MTPEEKAMTEKSMMSASSEGVAEKMPLKDLPSSSIDVAGATVAAADEKQVKPPSTPVTPPAPEPAKAVTNETTVTPSPTPAPETAPKKKRFSLPWAKKKDAAETVEASPPASAEAEQLTNEALVVMIDEKLKKMNGDEFVSLKLNKQGAFILIGIFLVFLWIIPVIFQQIPYLSQKQTQLLVAMHIKEAPASPTPVPSPTPLPLTAAAIRVRMGSNSLEAAGAVKSMLNTAGFNSIDLVYDPQVNPRLVMIVTKPGNEALKQALTQVFESTYEIASEAAELTSDSDFGATILIGRTAETKE